MCTAQSIAFPNISTGVYRYPKDAAAEAAVDEVAKYVEANDTSIKWIIFVCFDDDNLRIYGEKLAGIE